MKLKNSNLEKKPYGLNVHVGLNNANINTSTTATVIVTLKDNTTGVETSQTFQLVLGRNGAFADKNVLFSGLIVGHKYFGYIHVTAPGFATIDSPTNPPSQTVDQYG